MRLALCVEYKGTNYFGWQIQKHHKEKTIQFHVDRAISKIANHNVKTACGGRTDTGVHAFMQIVHFDTNRRRTKLNWVRGINSFLPDDILVKDIFSVDDEFHARFCVLDRTYRYLIINRPNQLVSFKDNFFHINKKIDLSKIEKSFKYLKCQRDFSTFRGSGCVSPSPVKNIKAISIKLKKHILIVDITANSFLYHMVRNIVGFLIDIGTGEIALKDVNHLIQDCDRRKIGLSVPPNGLYLLKIRYPHKYNINLKDKFSISI